MRAWLLSKAIPMRKYLAGKTYLSGDGVPKGQGCCLRLVSKSTGAGTRLLQDFFVDRIERPESPNVLLSATRLLYHMGKIFQSSAHLRRKNTGVQIDRKAACQLRRMRHGCRTQRLTITSRDNSPHGRLLLYLPRGSC